MGNAVCKHGCWHWRSLELFAHFLPCKGKILHGQTLPATSQLCPFSPVFTPARETALTHHLEKSAPNNQSSILTFPDPPRVWAAWGQSCPWARPLQSFPSSPVVLRAHAWARLLLSQCQAAHSCVCVLKGQSWELRGAGPLQPLLKGDKSWQPFPAACLSGMGPESSCVFLVPRESIAAASVASAGQDRMCLAWFV